MTSPLPSAPALAWTPDALRARLARPERLAALRATGLLDGVANPVLDRITRLAARLLQAPVAIVSLVDAEHSHLPGMTGVGGVAGATRVASLHGAPCARVVATGEVVAFGDAGEIPPDVLPLDEAAGMVAYLGVPLDTVDGLTLGAVCVADRRPRRWTDDDRETLADLAAAAASEIARGVSAARFRLAVDASQEVIYDHDCATGLVVREGAVEALYGCTADALPPTSEGWLALVHPDDRARVAATWREAVVGGMPRWSCEYRLRRPDGRELRVRDRARIIVDGAGRPQRIAGAVTDVTEQREAEQALRASEAQARRLLETAYEGIATVDRGGRITYANPRLAEMLGHTRDALAGTCVFDLMRPEDADATRRRLARSPVAQAELRDLPLRRADGTTLWTHVAVSDVDAPDGADAGALLLLHDLTERRAAEERFALAVEATDEGLWDWDVATGACYFSPRWARLLGHASEEIEPAMRSWERAVHPDDRPTLRDALDRHLRGETSHFACEHRVRHRDGTWVWVLGRGKVVRRDADGGARRMVGTLADIGERKAAERALADAEQRFRSLSASSPAGIFHADREARVTYVNPRLVEIWEMAPEATLGHGWQAHVHPEDLEPLKAAWLAALAADVEFEHQYRLRLPDGRVRWVNGRTAPLRDGAGNSVGVVGTIEDVTERVRLEEELRQAQKMEAVGRLAGGVAHDFNNLLTVISGNLDFVREDLPAELPADHPVRGEIAEIAEAAERARSLVRQLLAFSRKQPTRPQPVRVGELVAATEKLLRRVIGEEIALEVAVVDDAAVVHADPGQLEQVLLNLAVNARDAMLTPLHGHPGTGGTLSIEVASVALSAAEARTWDGVEAGRFVRLAVRDTGHGMDAATLAHAFEPFFTTKPVGAGTGLGLATVFGIVRQAGGSVRVESAPGDGASFTVLLPAAEAGRTPAPPVATPRPRARGATLLLAEDEAPVRLTTRRILERRGYRVLEARHGADALLVWREHRADIAGVVTDLRMPELGGRELVARIRGEDPSVPVVYVSGYADRGAVDARGPAEAFLEKPFTAEALLAAVGRVLHATAADGK